MKKQIMIDMLNDLKNKNLSIDDIDNLNPIITDEDDEDENTNYHQKNVNNYNFYIASDKLQNQFQLNNHLPNQNKHFNFKSIENHKQNEQDEEDEQSQLLDITCPRFENLENNKDDQNETNQTMTDSFNQLVSQKTFLSNSYLKKINFNNNKKEIINYTIPLYFLRESIKIDGYEEFLDNFDDFDKLFSDITYIDLLPNFGDFKSIFGKKIKIQVWTIGFNDKIVLDNLNLQTRIYVTITNWEEKLVINNYAFWINNPTTKSNVLKQIDLYYQQMFDKVKNSKYKKQDDLLKQLDYTLLYIKKL